MTKEELAAALDGREYDYRLITRDEARDVKASGLVIVHGCSDDGMSFDGAIDDEVGCYDGGTAYLYAQGLWKSDCGNDECPYAANERSRCKTIEAVWNDDGGPCWTYKTDIPHATFNIYEDGELWCVGIVFEMDALKS